MAKVANFPRAGKAAEAIVASPIALSLLFLELFWIGMFEVLRVGASEDGRVIQSL